jgi:DMSO/TMAO reductase YedYZ molybdopterin-dependent catalytic subunit
LKFPEQQMKLLNYNDKLLVTISLVMMACSHPAEETNIKVLEPVKVNEYIGELKEFNGENLSSIADFEENSIFGVQNIPENTYHLKITGLVNNPLEMTYDEVLNHEHFKKTVTLECVEGWRVKILWEGVLVTDLIKNAGIQPKAVTVIFHAADGYKATIPLDYIISNRIILAHRMNDLKLAPIRGFPFQLVAESKKGYTWIKWVTEIELSGDNPFFNF